MTIALSIIREEHRSLSAVTRSLRVLAQDARNLDSTPDYQLFTLILDYIEGFSGRFHHPKEEAYLFSAIRRRCGEVVDALDVLERDHARGEALLQDLRYLLARCRVGGAEAVESFAVVVEDYVDLQGRHLRLEEDVVLPLAEKSLTRADWRPIDAAFQANEDPLFGARPREEFQRLFQLIVNMAPAPTGADPSPGTGPAP